MPVRRQKHAKKNKAFLPKEIFNLRGFFKLQVSIFVKHTIFQKKKKNKKKQKTKKKTKKTSCLRQ